MLVSHAFRIGRVQYGPGTELGPRDSIGYEFVRVLKGQIQWEVGAPGESAVVHELGPGSFILSHPDRIERYRWDPKGVTLHDYVHFFLDDLPPSFPPAHQWPLVQQVQPRNVLNALFQYILDLNMSGHYTAMQLITRSLEQMLYSWAFGLHAFEERSFMVFSAPIQRAIDLVHNRWRDSIYTPPSLNEMVASSRVSRSTFLRAFQRECHAGPVTFFENQRIYLGRLHLLNTNRTIEEIAFWLGYPNPFQFSRSFKRIFQLSPRHYRIKGPAPLPADTIYAESHTFLSVFQVLSATQTV